MAEDTRMKLMKDVVHIKNMGWLKGTTLYDAKKENSLCTRFSRVPFALTTNKDQLEQRWKKPLPLGASFTYGNDISPGDYTNPSHKCPQLGLDKASRSNSSEDCLQLNIWVPSGEIPEGGWPVLFHIHGGFLQLGSCDLEPSALLTSTDVKCIIVSPNYRVGVLGFLTPPAVPKVGGGYSQEANFGFWDQRIALEWTHKNISSFGGNSDNITVGGYSAGSYSTFQQLQYDIGSQNKYSVSIIKRVIMWSNGCGVQPKTMEEAQGQYKELLAELDIPISQKPELQLEALRNVSTEKLLQAVCRMGAKFFRPVADNDFISSTLFQDIYSGAFGKRMKDLGIQIMTGDLTQEHHVYKMAHPPSSFDGLVSRLCWDYPKNIVDAVCEPVKDKRLLAGEWANAFGRLYADLQIHSTSRGLVQCIAKELPAEHVFRYRIDWRTRNKEMEKWLPISLGATHSTDMSIWFYGGGAELHEGEKPIVKEWLKPMGAFLRGDIVEWGTEGIKQVRYLTSEGKIEIKDDEVWDEKIPLWEVTKNVTSTTKKPRKIMSNL